MRNNTKKLGLFLLLIFCTIFLTACSLADLSLGLNQFFGRVLASLENFWESITGFFDDLPSVFEGILSGLSGIGEAIRRMFGNFSIF